MIAPKGQPLPYLRAWREWRGLSQDELAERAGIGVATIRRVEAGNRARYQSIEALSKALKVSRESLMRSAPESIAA